MTFEKILTKEVSTQIITNASRPTCIFDIIQSMHVQMLCVYMRECRVYVCLFGYPCVCRCGRRCFCRCICFSVCSCVCGLLYVDMWVLFLCMCLSILQCMWVSWITFKGLHWDVIVSLVHSGVKYCVLLMILCLHFLPRVCGRLFVSVDVLESVSSDVSLFVCVLLCTCVCMCVCVLSSFCGNLLSFSKADSSVIFCVSR